MVKVDFISILYLAAKHVDANDEYSAINIGSMAYKQKT